MNNPFYELTKIFDAVMSAGNGVTKTTVRDILIRETDMNNVRSTFYILKLLDEGTETFMHSDLADHRVSDAIKQIDDFKYKFVVHSATAQCSELSTKLNLKVYIPLFNSYGDTTSSLIKAESESIDRAELRDNTLTLMDDISRSELPEYAKKVLLIKMKALSRVLMECETYTDGEIRRRVKVVYADFCAEFRDNDKAYENFREKLYRWAKQGTGYGLFALALTADASAVTALLPAPTS